MNYVECTCGLVFTVAPIHSLLEHRERDHCQACRRLLVHLNAAYTFCRRCDDVRRAVA